MLFNCSAKAKFCGTVVFKHLNKLEAKKGGGVSCKNGCLLIPTVGMNGVVLLAGRKNLKPSTGRANPFGKHCNTKAREFLLLNTIERYLHGVSTPYPFWLLSTIKALISALLLGSLRVPCAAILRFALFLLSRLANFLQTQT